MTDSRPRPSLVDLLGTNVMILDGAIGTYLGMKSEQRLLLPELLCIHTEGQPLVLQVHGEYRDAGAGVHSTNTFAANRLKLKPLGFANAVEEINQRAAELCRDAVGPDRYVLGSIGPLDMHASDEALTSAEISAIYAQQITALAGAGVDGFLLETFSAPQEAKAALEEAAKHQLPILFSMSVQSLHRSVARRRIAEFADLAAGCGVVAIGLNCAPPFAISELIPALRALTDLPLFASPNAGAPEISRGVLVYQLPQSVLLRETQSWINSGIVMVGGCCGTTPEHIRALAEQFAGKPVQAAEHRRVPLTTPKPADRRKAMLQPRPNRLRQVLDCGEFLISVETRFELNSSVEAELLFAAELARAGVSFFDVPENPAGNVGHDVNAVAHLLRHRTECPVVVHKSATQTNLLHMYSSLLGAWDLEVDGVLAVTGDPPGVGPFDRFASRVLDLKSSVELIKLLRLLNCGELLNGQELHSPPDFVIACAFAGAGNICAQRDWLRKKLDAGAELIFTQPVFSLEQLKKMRTAVRGETDSAKILCGLLPLTGARQAAGLRSGRIPGIEVPEYVVADISRFDGAEDQAKAGLEHALTMARAIRVETEGLYLIPPFGKHRMMWSKQIIGELRTPQI